jgi:hypothetical protein
MACTSKLSVDVIRTLITQGQNDPMDLDKDGRCFLDLYWGDCEGYLIALNQEEFLIDIRQTKVFPLCVIAQCLAYSFLVDADSRQKSWEPALRRALQLSPSLTPNVPGTKTALDSLFLYYYTRQDSTLLAQDWLSLLASVGVNVDEYIREEKRIHNSGLLYRGLKYGPERRLIFEQEGSSKKHSIRWEWFYSPEDPACLVLTEFSAFGDIFHWAAWAWQTKWPFFYIETIKDLVHESWSEEERSEIKSKWAILKARWARQAARRQRRSEYSPRFKKPSRSERRLRVPGAWVEDHLPISFKWPRIHILRFPWWLYLFTIGVAFLMSGPNFVFVREFLGAKVRV